jgi:hypothetical protein
MKVVVTVKELVVKSTTLNIEPELMDTDNLEEVVLQKYNNGELDEQLEVDDVTTEAVIVEMEGKPHKLPSI